MRWITRLSLALVTALPCRAQQPAIDESPSGAFRLRHLAVDVALDFPRARLSGSATLDIWNDGSVPSTLVRLRLHRLLSVSAVADANGRPLPFTTTIRQLDDWPVFQARFIDVLLPAPVAPRAGTRVTVHYDGVPTGYAETGMTYAGDAIREEFTILREETLPWPVLGGTSIAAWRRLHADHTYRARITASRTVQVVNAGRLVRADTIGANVRWEYAGDRPVPYLLVMAGRYALLADRLLRVFYFPGDSLGARHLAERFRTARTDLERRWGPLSDDRPITIVEIPSGRGSQANVDAGIIQTAEAFRSPESISEAYHELTHLFQPPPTERHDPRWGEGHSSFIAVLLTQALDGRRDMDSVATRVVQRVARSVARDSLLRRVPPAQYGAHNLTGASYHVGFLAFYTFWRLLGPERSDEWFAAVRRTHGASGASIDDLVSLAPKTPAVDGRALLHFWLRTTDWVPLVEQATDAPALADAVHAALRPLTSAAGSPAPCQGSPRAGRCAPPASSGPPSS